MDQANILVVDDEPDIRELVREILEDEGYEVVVAEDGAAARMAFARSKPDLVLLDIWMPDVDGITLLKEWSASGKPDCPVVIMSGHGTVETAVEATRLGAHDFIQKPVSLARLLAVVSQALDSHQAREKPAGRTAPPVVSEPIGSSALMQVLRKKAERAARHDSPVLITGEPGSGRETLARFIHKRSNRDGKFVVLDPCDLKLEMLRTFMLGKEKNDGSKRDVGEQDRECSLFIPELQDISAAAMRIINQVLESDHYLHQGGSDSLPLNCRVIASGSTDLINRSQEDPLLQQLYYKLNVLPLQVPPLRERKDDIPELVRFYAEWFPNHESLPYRPFSVSAQNRLRNHSWPGNLRELGNLVRRLLILGGEGEVTVDDVENALRENPGTLATGGPQHPKIFDLPLREAREQFEREYLTYKLHESGGSVGKLAKAVGMERTHLYRKLRALGINPKTAARKGNTT
ncbi:MAG: sigma-54 dependent transcriptional regulator [Xanthomonadales bacterium]